jgi:hypothetical protein
MTDLLKELATLEAAKNESYDKVLRANFQRYINQVKKEIKSLSK